MILSFVDYLKDFNKSVIDLITLDRVTLKKHGIEVGGFNVTADNAPTLYGLMFYVYRSKDPSSIDGANIQFVFFGEDENAIGIADAYVTFGDSIVTHKQYKQIYLPAVIDRTASIFVTVTEVMPKITIDSGGA